MNEYAPLKRFKLNKSHTTLVIKEIESPVLKTPMRKQKKRNGK